MAMAAMKIHRNIMVRKMMENSLIHNSAPKK